MEVMTTVAVAGKKKLNSKKKRRKMIKHKKCVKEKDRKLPMAGLGLFDQKSVIAVTMPIVTAFKFCIGHRKNGLLNR
jgi:hypothetical protein